MSLKVDPKFIDSSMTTDQELAAEASERQTADANIQSEVNATQSGAGLGTDGSYSAPVGSNYLGSAVSLKDADSKLDTQIKTVADGLAETIASRQTDSIVYCLIFG